MSAVSSSNLYIGVAVIGEHNQLNSETEEQIVGFITVESADISAADVRQLLHEQLPILFIHYVFLSKNRWPVAREQESKLKASFLINERQLIIIQKKFDSSRVGIRLSCSRAVGFVFVDENSNLQDLRDCIKNQLFQSCCELSQGYRFWDCNHWPVTSEQESQLTVFDVSRNSEVYVELLMTSSMNKRRRNFNQNSETVDNALKRPNSLDISSSTITGSESGPPSAPVSIANSDTAYSFPVFISYVRAEASDHALDLKRVLADKGLHAYLDVHEIKAGVDWQDSLNKALHECSIFVALVTPKYGLTKWSNREIKLADMKLKQIVPISFLDDWPPDCLAIQFTSTQFIPWKTADCLKKEIEDGEIERARNINFWDTEHIERVADHILDRQRNISQGPMGPECMMAPTPEFSSTHGIAIAMPVVVISHHPIQKNIAYELRLFIGKKGYDVWCTTDSSYDQLNAPSSVLSSPMTPIASEIIHNGSGALHSDDSVENLFSRRNAKQLSWSSSIDGPFSQFSDCSQASNFSPDKINQMEAFRKRVNDARVVVLLLSEEYIKSRTCRKQAYYCEHRKQIIAIKCKEFDLTPWITSLIGNNIILNLDEKDTLMSHVNSVSKQVTPVLPEVITKERKMTTLTNRILEKWSEPLCNCVYVAGSTKFFNAKSEAICHAVGIELASVPFIALVTGGFYGVGDSVGRNFCEERQIRRIKERIFHILPERESKEYSHKAKQDSDGKFLKVPYGESFFYGESARERECLVARLFNICILIEGGPGAAHEAEQFMWNDHIVIPVQVTGGAAGGRFGMPTKMFECPPGVDEEDWSAISNIDCTADDIAAAIRRIVCSLYKSPGFLKPGSIKRPSKKTRSHFGKQSGVIP